MAEAILSASGIYAIVNMKNAKFYIGQSVNLAARRYDHYRSLRLGKHSNRHLQASAEAYGIDALLFVVVEYVEPDRLTEREQYWIDEGCHNGLYNIAPAAGTTRGLKLSEGTKAKMAEAHRGQKHTEETKRKISESAKGRVRTEQHRINAGLARFGKSPNAEHRKKLSDAVKAFHAKKRAA